MNTTIASGDAIVLFADKDAITGTAGDGNIIVSGIGDAQIAAGARALLYSGNKALSSGINFAIGVMANRRYNVDATTVLGTINPIITSTGKFALFRLSEPLLSSDADLSALSTTAGTLSTVFAAATTAYSVNVINATTSITITPSSTHPEAIITVNGVLVRSGVASGTVALSVGANTISTQVFADNGIAINTYTITVTRAAGTNANLAALSTTAGVISPVFAAATIAYSARVNNATTSITVSPTVADIDATVTVNGIPVTSASASAEISLNVGLNIITTVITASDGTTTRTYTLTVTRSPIYYANSATGDEANDGLSVNTAKKTFAAVFALAPSISTIELAGTFSWDDVNETTDASATGFTLNKNLTIRGQGANQTIIQSNAVTNTADRRVFTIPVGVSIVLEKLTIRNGKTSSDGGGISNVGILSLNYCRINGNNASGGGGGLNHMGVNTLLLYGCTFDNNTAPSGGAIKNGEVLSTAINMRITNCTFAFNSQTATVATVGGAAIWVLDGVSTITNCTFAYNNLAVGTGRGASIFMRHGNVRLKNNIFVNNTQGGNALGANTSEIDNENGTANDNGFNIFGRQRASFMPLNTTSWFDSNSGGGLDGTYAINGLPLQTGLLNISSSLSTNSASNGIVTLVSNGVNQNNGSAIANNAVPIPTVDQRDFLRFGLTDIGSFETASTNADLSALTLSTGTLSPSFATGTKVYTATVNNATTSITVTPTRSDTNATITVNGTAVSSGSASGAITLNVGTNTIDIVVMAQDGTTTETYAVTVTRDAPLSVLTPEFQNQISLYPNPSTNGSFTIVSPSGFQNARLKMYNLIGQEVYNTTIETGTTYNISSNKALPSGTYLIQLEQDGQKIIKKLIIN